LLPKILEQVPAGTSTKTFVHYAQLVNSGRFERFDYGWINNWMEYGSIAPPEYDITQVTTPALLYWSDNDLLVHDIVRSMNNLIFK
jgi:lysosomal acid lipase/cholesteryl ester hydrolase